MAFINQNIKYLRNRDGMTQQAFADRLGIKRSALGAYEEGRAKPSYELMEKLADDFDLTFDQLIREDLTMLKEKSGNQGTATSHKLRVLSITVDEKDREYIDLVPQKAAAGYLSGYADPEFVEELPKFKMPILRGGTYRAFEITGDSMLPIQPGSIVIGSYVEDVHEIKDGQTYVLLSESEGIVYKRIFNKIGERGELILQSDNPSYPPYSIPAGDVIEVWQAEAYISTVFPNNDVSLEKLMNMVMELQQEVIRMKKPGENA